mmetsp:Transcript_13956/g.18621  ORF Transcript_13956/g.18621 Transcript_13956/m.18621 type:complete len:168 (+) Transcript_13956:73-576(+)
MLRVSSVCMKRVMISVVRSTAVRHQSVPSLGDELMKTSTRPRRRRNKALTPAAAPQLSDDEWKTVAIKYVSDIGAAFAEASAMNKGSIENDGQGNVSIFLGEGRGYFSMSLNATSRTIDLISPFSGILQYVHYPDTNSWLHTKDHHDIKGLLVRDFLRVGCVGLPKI